jgi:hypothetical protein
MSVQAEYQAYLENLDVNLRGGSHVNPNYTTCPLQTGCVSKLARAGVDGRLILGERRSPPSLVDRGGLAFEGWVPCIIRWAGTETVENGIFSGV